MRHTPKTVLKSAAALAAAAALAPLGHAQDAPQPGDDATVVFIEQTQAGSLAAGMTVHAAGEGTVAGSATSIGNSAAALLEQGEVDYDAFQTMTGNSVAALSLTGGHPGAHVIGSSTAYGNAFTGGTWDGNTFYRAEQLMTGDVAAATDVLMAGAATVATTTVAAANVSNPSSEHGDNRAFQVMDSRGNVSATTNATLCCVDEHGTFVTLASGNAATSSGASSTVFNGAVMTTAENTSILAQSQVASASAANITSAVTAAGNSYALHNTFGYATLGRSGSELFQENNALIGASSVVSLDSWSGGAVSTAYGVGNSAAISNAGTSNTGLFANQFNNGNVGSIATLSGTSLGGGAGFVNSTAIGNTATATLCVTCTADGLPALQGGIRQVNAGAVSAQGAIVSGGAGTLVGQATAIGNAATFTAQNTGH